MLERFLEPEIYIATTFKHVIHIMLSGLEVEFAIQIEDTRSRHSTLSSMISCSV